jgi:hypothetical protein
MKGVPAGQAKALGRCHEGRLVGSPRAAKPPALALKARSSGPSAQ